MSDKQKAGTALLMAAASVSFAAGLVARTEPHLKNAPMDAQIDDLLNLLRDTLIQKKPQLNVVSNTGEATMEPTSIVNSHTKECSDG